MKEIKKYKKIGELFLLRRKVYADELKTICRDYDSTIREMDCHGWVLSYPQKDSAGTFYVMIRKPGVKAKLRYEISN